MVNCSLELFVGCRIQVEDATGTRAATFAFRAFPERSNSRDLGFTEIQVHRLEVGGQAFQRRRLGDWHHTPAHVPGEHNLRWRGVVTRGNIDDCGLF